MDLIITTYLTIFASAPNHNFNFIIFPLIPQIPTTTPRFSPFLQHCRHYPFSSLTQFSFFLPQSSAAGLLPSPTVVNFTTKIQINRDVTNNVNKRYVDVDYLSSAHATPRRKTPLFAMFKNHTSQKV